jgi:hypothetical protein
MPEPGLDAAQHAAAQKAAHQADVLRRVFLPACFAAALSTGKFDASAFRSDLDQFIRDAGNPTVPVERLLLEQLAFANFRIGDLHTQAAQAKSIETIKVFTSAAARLLGEVRRVALTLQAYRSRTPATKKARIARVG